MPKTLIGLAADQHSALSNYLFQAHEKIENKSFLNCPFQQRGGKVPLAMCGRVSINETENKFVEEKKSHTFEQPGGAFSSIIKRFFLKI